MGVPNSLQIFWISGLCLPPPSLKNALPGIEPRYGLLQCEQDDASCGQASASTSTAGYQCLRPNGAKALAAVKAMLNV
jgi:hypothetical protein